MIYTVPPTSSSGREVDVTCSAILMTGASERKLRSFPSRARSLGLGTVGGQLQRETIIGIVAVRVSERLGLPVDVSDWPLRCLPVREFLGTTLGANGQVSIQRFRGEDEGCIHIPRIAATGWFCAPIVVLQIAKGTGS